MKPKKKPTDLAVAPAPLLGDLRGLILVAREQAARSVNTALTLLYWRMGDRIRRDILGGKRAGYGEEILQTLSAKLIVEFGRGFEEKNLRRMLQLAEAFPDHAIVATLSRQLTWSHFVTLLPLSDPLKRDLYAEMCRVENWSVRTLRTKVQSMLFERTALSRKPAVLAQQELAVLRDDERLSPDLVFPDPYFLDFLGLRDTFAEKDLEAALVREIESFLLELGAGFSFIERQKRITLDGDDHYLDLLFYHRRLRRLVLVELKIGDFKAADSGQVELYLRWLDKYERQPGEEAPLAIILCAGRKQETVELLELDKSGIHVAEYITELPPRSMLEQKLHAAIAHARHRAELAAPSGSSKATPRKPAKAAPAKRPKKAAR